jgi:glycosyltransferase involved in cell wall biosynthesis
MARVSAIIPVFNGAATVAEAIDSALSQTFRDLEIIVVDDGSTDATPQVLQRYADYLKVIRQPKRGIAAARNRGVAAASGEYLAFLDCDDTWRPQRIERAVAALDADPGCVLGFCNLVVVDSNGVELARSIVGAGLDHAPSLKEMLTRLWPIMPSAVVMRRAAFDAVGGFPEEFSSYGYEDVYTWLLVREQGHFHYDAEQLGQWRFSLFPRPLKIGGTNRRARRTFDRLLRERFGVSAAGLMRSRLRASRSILGYIGLNAMLKGDQAGARRALMLALRVDPFHLKTYFRLLRTFLPHRLARALTGRTRGAGGGKLEALQ